MTRTRTTSWRTRVVVAVVGACLGLGITGMGAAFGYWVTTDPLNPAQAVANSLPEGATPYASVSSTSYDTVTISFAEVATTTGGVEIPASDYVLQRYPSKGGSSVTVTASCSGTGTITCTEASMPDGTWQYTDTPTYAANWVGIESAMSGPVTVSTTATVSVTYPVDNTTYGADWTGTITGTASSATGATIASTQVAIEDTTTKLWWSGTSFSASTQTFVPVSGTTTWMLGLGADNLTSGDSYSVIAEATDNASNVGTSSMVAFTYGTTTTATTPPTVSVTYPVDHTTYGADWTGTITGTASSNSGASTTITAAAMVAIKDTTTNQWWNGTAFAASTQSFVAATGDTTWYLPFGWDNLTPGDSYSVVAQATDSAGNVGTSSTVAFTYGTTTTTTTTTATTPPTTTTTTTTTPPTTTTTTTTTPPTTTTTTATTPPTTTTTTATTPPTVGVTYPVDNTTYGADWTGTITGTASSNSGASTTIASTQVAIEDTTADKWWSGTSFSASTQTFVPATDTTTWMLGFGADNLTPGDSYSVVAEATDSASNVGTSSTVAFTYGTTTTTSTTTTSTTTTTTPPTTSTTTTSLASA
jgi:hypothetical protein